MSAEHKKPAAWIGLSLQVLKRQIRRVFYAFFIRVKLVVFHSDLRRKTVNGKGYNDHVYYVVRGYGKDYMAGLFALYYLAGGQSYVALKQNQIPYIDFECYPCQYSVDREINGTKNAWEYYFEQPSPPPRGRVSEVYTAGKKIILSGWNPRKLKKERQLTKEWENMTRQERASFFKKYIPVKNYIQEEVQKIYREQFEGNNVLGVFMRGTDYVSRKPVGHRVQPTPEQVKNKIDEFLAAYKIDKIFLVTEDWNNYQYIKNIYGDRVFCSDYEFVTYDVKNDKWVNDSFHDDPYERGKRYLIRIMLLSMCKYYIGGQATGSRYALDIGNFDAEYSFDLGVY